MTLLIIIARKSFDPGGGGTVVSNTLEWSTGGLNVDGCRVMTTNRLCNTPRRAASAPIGTFVRSNPSSPTDTSNGRWPANVVLSNVSGYFPKTVSMGHLPRTGKTASCFGPNRHACGDANNGYNDSGSASRFFKSFPQVDD